MKFDPRQPWNDLPTLPPRAPEYAKNTLPKIYSRELIDVIFVQPYCRIQNLVDAGVAKRQTAAIYLNALVAAKVLEERRYGRDKLFVHPTFLTLLTRDGNTFKSYPAAKPQTRDARIL